MHGEPLIPIFVLAMLAILATSILLKKIKQPYVIAYLITGVILGPYGIDMISDHESLSRLGEVGVILLLFFAGMEVSPRKFAQNWKVPTIGTTLQILVSILLTVALGYFVGWNFAKMFLYGSAICLSSTAVVLKLLEEKNETKTRLGQNILGVLLVQDLAVVPMLIIIGLLGGNVPTPTEIIIQIIGGVLVIALAAWMAVKDTIKLPFVSMLGQDKEMRVFTALIICFGMASITGALGLSSALGAFIGGMIVATAKETEWVAHSLQTVKTVFMAIFFVSIGMLIDLNLIWENLGAFTALLLATYVVNTIINTLIFKSLKETWCEAISGAAMLSQIGEFSFVLISMAFSLSILSTQTYEFCISLISLSLLFSPLWIATINKLVVKYVKN
mgnify:CR=1 FL=1